jgi:glycosyltransferase involved in cell wall biosynthesis
MMRKTRVLVFTNSFRTGGSERQATELIKRLDRSRFEPLVACFRNEGPFIEELKDCIQDLQIFPLTSFCNSTALREAGRFLSFLRKARVDVLQSFDLYANLFAIPLARLAGVPIVLGCRRDEGVMRSKAHQMAERACYSLATGVVANARAIKDQLVRRDGLESQRVWVIPNGLDLDRFHALEQAGPGRKHDEVTVAVVANLRPEKGHLVYLDAVQRLLKPLPNVRFLIVGGGIIEEDIRAAVRDRGLSERVTMTGIVNPIPPMLKSIDIIVLPSLSNEGLPNSVMEAMAASLPVVATDTGGTGELVIDGHTGFLIPPGDSAVLADRIERLCRDAELRRKMGEAGRNHIVQHYTVDRMARKFEALFDDLFPHTRRMEA